MKLKKFFTSAAVLLLCATSAFYIPARAAELPSELIPGGHTMGIKVFTEGVLVIGSAPVPTSEGEQDPAGLAGLAKGDIITHIDDKPILSAEEMLLAVRQSEGREMLIRLRREGKTEEVKARAVQSDADGELKLGIWIRDSMAGIGTITFYDPVTRLFGALGHGVNDTETGELLDIRSGTVVHSTVVDVTKGQSGIPGELRGRFDSESDGGELLKNTDNGVFGILREESLMGDTLGGALPVAAADQLKTGPATILSNVSGDEIAEYRIEITKLISDNGKLKSFMLKVADDRLIGITGGIVQGMSGSPVIQDGRIVGAVTHVLINDPRRGYGVFIGSMLEDGIDTLGLNPAEEAA